MGLPAVPSSTAKPPVLVAGRHDADGWKALLLLTGAEPVALTAAQARDLCCELSEMAGFIEHGWIP